MERFWDNVSIAIMNTEYFTAEFWTGMITGSTSIFVIVLLAWAALHLRKVIIFRIFRISRMEDRQKKTLVSLLMSITKYTIYIIAFILILSNMGIDVAPILAGAGVLGLAVGFGAQTLVKDFITGFFIIFEDQFSVGDYVTLNDGQINGTVISVGLRATKIRTWAQHVVTIPNSEIRTSQNYNRERMRAIVYVNVPYEIDPGEVESAINELSRKMVNEMPHLFLEDESGNIMEAPKLYGITDVENQALGAKYAVIALVKDQHYWTTCNLLRKGLIETLRARGIEISYPRQIEKQVTSFSGRIDV